MRFAMLAAVAALWVQPASAAVTLTFEGASNALYLAPIQRDGYEIGTVFGNVNAPVWSDGGHHFHEYDSTPSPYGNGSGVLLNDTDHSLYIKAADGGTFALSSFDIAAGTSLSTNFVVRGYLHPINTVDGPLGTPLFTITAPLGQFANYVGFDTQIDYLTFFGASNFNEAGFMLDNVVLDRPQSAVPEPSTWAMMLLGFGFVGAGVRRKRKQFGTEYLVRS
jgi:hypothetical protein